MYRFFSRKNFLNSIVPYFQLGFIALAVSFPASEVFAQEEDLCPLPSSAISQAPDDLSKVQADIDRFTLCVERAQLLGRLNDLALENQESISALVQGTSDEILAPVFNDSNIPDFSVTSQDPVFSAPPTDTVGGFAPDIPPAPVFDPPPAAPVASYIVTNVFGSAGSLQAKIVGDSDYNAQVRIGDSLPDGSTIESISATEVVIKNESGDQTVLDWQEEESE